MRYAIVIEKTVEGFSSYVPDLPGCVATADSRGAAEIAIREAIEFHLAGLKQDGEPPPPASSTVDYVDVAA